MSIPIENKEIRKQVLSIVKEKTGNNSITVGDLKGSFFKNLAENDLTEFQFIGIATAVKAKFKKNGLKFPASKFRELKVSGVECIVQRINPSMPGDSVEEASVEEELVATSTNALQSPKAVPVGSLDAFLAEKKLNLFGSWSGGENTLDLSYQNDEKNVALVSWTSVQGTVVSLVGGNREVAIPETPPQSNVAKRLVADGFCFNKDGKKEEMKVLAEFEFDPANEQEITKFSLRICPASKEDVPKHIYALIEVRLTKPKSVNAKLFDHDDNQLGAVMKKQKQ